MTDLLGGVLDTVGKAAEPLSPAIDFLAPESAGGGQEVDLGTLFSSIGRGATNFLTEGPVGMVGMAGNALQNEGSTRDRLLMGGMALAGVGMSARAAHNAWSASKRPAVKTAAASGYPELTEQLGDPQRFVDLTEAGEDILYQRPGINRRQAQILSSDDGLSVARGFSRWGDDDVQTAAGAGLFEEYARRNPEGARGAQVDWARWDLANDRGLLPATGGNEKIRKLWNRATTDPASLEPDDAEELYGAIKAFGDATDAVVSDDLTIGYVGRLSGVQFDDGEVSLFVEHPVDWNDGRIVDRKVREQRLAKLNVRAFAEDGRKILKKIYEIGSKDYDLFARTGQHNLPDGMELGPEWYPRALRDVARTFDVSPDNPADADALSRAVAAVSFLSEAENWDTNIVKARKVLDRVGDISDEDFQNFLRHNIKPVAGGSERAYQYAGKSADKHRKRLNGIHELVRSGPPGEKGFQVDLSTLKKILRLYGGTEAVEQVFRSTAARKQKNFYLNIRHPEMEHPVTIDRHAYDAFLGLDSGLEDRPIDLSLGDGDQVYDVVADTYRSLARELEVPPHALQAVVWETWRALKGTAGRDGWARHDPFMISLNDPDQPFLNRAHEALNGRGALPAHLDGDLSGPVPARLLEAGAADGLTSATIGDGVMLMSKVDDRAATAARHMTPGVVGGDRAVRWIDAQPQRVHDLETFKGRAMADRFHVTVQQAADVEKLGGPVSTRPGEWITMSGTGRIPKGSGTGHRVGRSRTETTDLRYDKLDAEDIDPDAWNGPNSPLNTHAWAAISAERPGADNLAATNRLRHELQEAGYRPIEQTGYYGEGPEASFLVFGITPDEALTIGERYGQDSVITNNGFLYHRTAPPDSPELAGQMREGLGIEFNTPSEFRSEINLNGRTVNWAMDLDWDNTAEVDVDIATGRQARSGDRVEMKVAPGQDLDRLVTELEGRGFQVDGVYTNRPSLDGFERAYEQVATDGVEHVTVRTRDGASSAAHGGHVFVRSASGLPTGSDAAPQPGWQVLDESTAVAGNTITVRGEGRLEFGAEPFDVKVNGQKATAWGYGPAGQVTPLLGAPDDVAGSGFDAVIRGKQVLPADEADTTAAIRAGQHMIEAGYADSLNLKVSTGTFPLAKAVETTPDSGTLTTKGGLVVPKLHKDRPLSQAEEKFGFGIWTGWREGNEVLELDPQVAAQVTSGVERVMNGYAAGIHRTRLRGVSVERWTDDGEPPYAWATWNAGGQVGLSREWQRDPADLLAALADERATGFHTNRVPATMESIIVHELGHVLHLATHLGEGMKQNTAVDRAVREVTGGRAWRKGAAHVSELAASDESELVAESFLEVMLSAAPSRTAQNVWDVVSDRLGATLKYRSLTA